MLFSLIAIQQTAEKHGATHVREVNAAEIQAEQCYRDACATNACGKYGKYWTCPPGIGDPDAILADIKRSEQVYVIQNIAELEDSWDFEGMGEAAVRHQATVRAIAADIRNAYPELDVVAMSNGGCSLCPQCSYPDAPCRHPDQMMQSMEGVGINVKLLVEGVGLKYINGQNTVSYVGMVYIRKPEQE